MSVLRRCVSVLACTRACNNSVELWSTLLCCRRSRIAPAIAAVTPAFRSASLSNKKTAIRSQVATIKIRHDFFAHHLRKQHLTGILGHEKECLFVCLLDIQSVLPFIFLYNRYCARCPVITLHVNNPGQRLTETMSATLHSTNVDLDIPAVRQQLERDGYYCPLPVLTPDEVRHYLAQYNDYSARNQARLDELPANQKYKVLSQTHFALPWVYEIVTHPRILTIMEGLLGPNLLAWDTNWFSKMPGEQSYVGWHQDGTYWNLRPPNVVTAWVALSPSTAANGCMRVIPGTHTQPMMPQRETYIPENALSRGQEIAAEVNESKAVDLSLQPGEMSLHHIWIVHGSGNNTSAGTPRIGIAIRYTTPEVHQESPAKPLALLVRGHDDHGHFEIQPPPQPRSDAEQQQFHSDIVTRIRAGIMTDAARKFA